MNAPEPAGEFGLIAWIREQAARHPAVSLGIGDDCAALNVAPGRPILVTTDMLLEGRHFHLETAGPEAVGYKALAVNLSDIAAMAGQPLAAFVSVALPRHLAVPLAQSLFHGMKPLADRFQVALAGGDTNAWDGPLVISITLVGQATDRGLVTRAGALPGDVIAVTGSLGGSLISSRHLKPKPRVQEALDLHKAADLHAMIDLSDGLSSDLAHIMEESRVGADLSAGWIPIHPDAHIAARADGRSPLEHALCDGEDFELCVVLSQEDFACLQQACVPGVTLYQVGTIVERDGLLLQRPDGSCSLLPPGGFDHLASSPSARPQQ